MIYGTPTIVTNGLALNLDALNSKSIPVDPTVNLALWSQDFSRSVVWNKSTYDTITTGSTAPDGTPTATLIDETNAYLDPSTISQPNIIATSPTITYSIYTKKGTATFRSFLLRNSTTSTNFTGLSFQYSISSSATGWTVQDVGNNWFRLSYTQTTGITPGDIIQIYAGRSGAATSGSTATWYVWGAQVEATSYATPYIISTSTNGRRNTWSDLSRNNNTATLLSSSISGSIPTFPSAGNRVLQFDGTSSYALVSGSSTLQPSSSFTLECLFTPKNINNGAWIVAYTGDLLGATVKYGFRINFGNILVGYISPNSSAVAQISSNSLTINTPIAGTLSYDGSFARIYCNGLLINSASISGSMDYSVYGAPFFLTMGRKNTPDGAYTSENISSVRLYNRALSQAEITQNYNATKTRFGLT
jgi:hypothetical protein